METRDQDRLNGFEDKEGIPTAVYGGAAVGPGTQIGPYKLVSILGEGGCGIVYLAEQQRPVKRRVALKVIKPGMDSKQVIARFEAERQALALLNHPNIAHVFNAGTTEAGRPYFAMQYVKGVPITEHCDRYKLTIEERLKLFMTVCGAVQHAHQKAIIHRDIKPSNILVAYEGEQAVPMIIDFGVAKALSQSLTERTLVTEQAQMIGTPEYMSPEQAEMTSQDIDTRTDVYSLGVLLYELLTGTLPFDSQTLREGGIEGMRRMIRERDPKTPSLRLTQLQASQKPEIKNRKSKIANELDWITLKAMDKDRTRRYQTAYALAEDIQRYLNQEPVLAGPPSMLYKAQKLVVRNKGLFASAVAIAAILILATVVSTQQSLVARTERRAAQQERDRAREAEQRAQRERTLAMDERDRAEREKLVAQQNAYSAKMLLARVDWDNDDIRRLRQTLAETEGYPNRGFEWYYWQRMCRLELMSLRAHDGPVFPVIYSPDGRFIASASGRKAHIWYAKTGREVVTCEGHKDEIYGLAYSPDGRLLATGSADHTARIWDVQTGRQVHLLRGYTGGIERVHFSPDGRQVATACYDGTARVWDAATGREVLCLRGHSKDVYGVDFSPDGNRIVTASGDTTIRLWELPSGREIRTLTGHDGVCYAAEFTPDGRRIVSASLDGTAKVWDAARGDLLLTYRGHTDQVYFATVSPDGKSVVSGSPRGAMKIWDVIDGRELMTLKAPRSYSFSAAAFSPDGQQIVSGSEDGIVKVWNAVQEQDALVLKHPGFVAGVAFSPEGRRLATASRDDSTVKIWDTLDGRLLQTLAGHRGWILSVAFAPNGDRIVGGRGDGAITVWNVLSGQELLTASGHSDSVACVAFAPDGRRFTSASADRTVRVWDATTGQPLSSITGGSDDLSAGAMSPDGRLVCYGNGDGILRLLDVASGREVLSISGHQGAVRAIAFSPRGDNLVSGGSDRAVRIWRVSDGHRLLSFENVVLVSDIRSLAFSPTGDRLVVGTFVGELKVLDPRSGQELLALTGHRSNITSAAFSPDGLQIASSSWDGTARVWQAASEVEVKAWHDQELLDHEEQTAREAKKEEEAERQRLVRLSDAGALKPWLVLAPIPVRTGQPTASALEEEQVANEACLCPVEGQRASAKGTEMIWKRTRFEDAILDFNKHLGRVFTESVGYAVCYLMVPEARRGVLMKVGSDDAARVYLNKRLVYEYPTGRPCVADQDTVAEIELEAGINTVVFKVVNEGAGWQGSLRFTDGDGNPLDGLTVTLNPDSINNN